MQYIRRGFRQHEGVQSLLLLMLITFLAYCPMIPWLGFYADDWFNLQWERTNNFGLLVTEGRPVQGLVNAALFGILGESVLLWHIASFVLILLCAVATLFMLRSLWPKRPFLAVTCAVLFTIFPGFSAQSISIMYIGYRVMIILSFVSLGFTLNAQESQPQYHVILYTLIALAAALGSWLTIELMFGMEIVRLCFIWLKNRQRASSRQALALLTIKQYLPYAGLFIVYFIWRFIFISQTRSSTNSQVIAAQYVKGFSPEFIIVMFEKIVHATFDSLMAWFAAPYNAITLSTTYRVSALVGLVVGLIGAIAFWQYAIRRKDGFDEGETRHAVTFDGHLAILGLGIIILVVSIPVFAQQAIRLFYFYQDRFLIASGLGSAFVLFACVRWLGRRSSAAILLSVLIGSAICVQFLYANAYRVTWQQLDQAWWQISWRIPQIKPGTTVILDTDAFAAPYSQAMWPEDIWGPLYIIYGSPTSQPDIAGEQFLPTTPRILENPALPDPAREVDTYSFTPDIRQNIVISIPPSQAGCVHVLDGTTDELPAQTDLTTTDIRYSDLSLILTNTPQQKLPESIFGAEPVHAWCYYFQKAELLRQQGNWQQIEELGTSAHSLNLKPIDSIEWMPFLDAYLHTGDDDMLLKQVKEDHVPLSGVCSLLQHFHSAVTTDNQVRAMETDLACPS